MIGHDNFNEKISSFTAVCTRFSASAYTDTHTVIYTCRDLNCDLFARRRISGTRTVGTFIFDEIDAGISGRTAQKVSEKLKQLSKERQVICITHLPQIAAMADSHFEIRKEVEGTHTKTIVDELDEEASIRELARMLGGVEITESVINNAKEMKTLANRVV